MLRGYFAHILTFFFSSRRRHTRWTGDWSSDVCSSDLCRRAWMWRSRSSKGVMNALIGRKLGMTRLFGEDGAHVPVTVIEAGPCAVVQVREREVQLGFGVRKATRSPKALVGHVKPAGLAAVPRVLRSFPAVAQGEGEPPKPGESVTVAIFAAGDRVKVTGV